MNHSAFGTKQQDSNSSPLEMLLKLYIWLEQSQTYQPSFLEDFNHNETNSTDEILGYPVSNTTINPFSIIDSNHLLVNNTFQPIVESPTNSIQEIMPITTNIPCQNSDSKKRKHDESFPFVCHTLESMKEEEERKKTQPKRPRGRPRKHSFEQKFNDTKRIKHE